MPTISIFYGIVITMFFGPTEHPPPHFHAKYAEFKARIDIQKCEILDGKLPSKQTKLVLAWAELHKEDLMINWVWR